MARHRIKQLIPYAGKDRQEYAERAVQRGGTRSAYLLGLPQVHVGRVPDAEVRAALLAIPPDTRSLTGRIMGDPLPARSALAAREE